MPTSSYLRYLPRALWENDPPGGGIGSFLCIFEKILTGIDDGIPIGSGAPSYPSVEAEIARVHRLFDPAVAPQDFLEELASWVALSFPKAGQTHLWDEFQRRKLISGVVQFYRRRGLRDGLNRYLELYTVATTRPRIALDDGARVLFSDPSPGASVEIHGLITQGPDSKTVKDGLVRPLAIAASAAGDDLFVTDQGTPGDWPEPVKAGVWRIPGPGLNPRRLGDAAFAPAFPMAVGVRPSSGSLYVLDRTGLFELAAPSFAPAVRKATSAQLGAGGPVAMCFLPDDRLLILDRGVPFQSGSPAAPQLIEVKLTPLSVRRIPLTGVVEPMSLCVTPSGQAIAGDARDQDRATPADLVSIDLTSGAATRILGDAASRLTAPAAVVAEDETNLLVLDVGLKPYFPGLDSNLEPYVRHIAEPATLYRVKRGTPPEIALASVTGSLVFPTGMALRRGRVFISDKGEFSDPQSAGATLRVWRAVAQEFGVAVHFSKTREPSESERRRILHDIREIVEREKPAHTNWTMLFSS